MFDFILAFSELVEEEFTVRTFPSFLSVFSCRIAAVWMWIPLKVHVYHLQCTMYMWYIELHWEVLTLDVHADVDDHDDDDDGGEERKDMIER